MMMNWLLSMLIMGGKKLIVVKTCLLFWFLLFMDEIWYWSRHIPDKWIGANAGYGQNLGYTDRNLIQKYEFHSGLFDKSRKFSRVLDVRPHYVVDASAEQERKSKKMLKYLTGLVFAMVAGSYAAVPLYRRFCQATGYGGTVQRREVRLKISSF